MTKEELKQEAEEYVCKRNPLVTKEWFIDAFKKYDKGEKVKYLKDCEIAEYEAYLAGVEPREKRIAELEAQIEKLIDFVLSKTECCDVCPITDTCINSEGTCPYVGILAKGEEEVTREWLMQKITKGE